MRKIVINRCYGGFSLSVAGTKAYYACKGIPCYAFKNTYKKNGNRFILLKDGEEEPMFASFYSIENPNEEKNRDNFFLSSRPEKRDDTDLVAVVEELGEKSWGSCAELKIVEIPNDVEWEIDEYDGLETVEEKHCSWF